MISIKSLFATSKVLAHLLGDLSNFNDYSTPFVTANLTREVISRQVGVRVAAALRRLNVASLWFQV